MLQILRPRAFVPVHGTHHHRRRHLEIAMEEGIKETQMIANGEVLEVTPDAMRIVDEVRTGRVYVDGMQPLGAEVIVERRAMGATGLVTLFLPLAGGRIRHVPVVSSRGVFALGDRGRIESELAEHVRHRLKAGRFASPDELAEAAIETARRFLVHNHRKRPLIVAEVYGDS